MGWELSVLFEERRDGLWRGYTTRYSEVAVDSGENLHNQLKNVQISAVDGGCLRGIL